MPFSSPGYHTTLKGGFVHPTRESLIYALALFDQGEVERAEGIIRKVLSLQDTDPRHHTYGIWALVCREEPLCQMAPPVWNWADFCSQELFGDSTGAQEALGRGSPGNDKKLRFHAVNSIIRRDVHRGYTNIALIGAFVDPGGRGVFVGRRSIIAMERTPEKVYQHTLQEGSFLRVQQPRLYYDSFGCAYSGCASTSGSGKQKVD